jgi:tetratricopeptide (TPR) repeat protein
MGLVGLPTMFEQFRGVYRDLTAFLRSILRKSPDFPALPYASFAVTLAAALFLTSPAQSQQAPADFDSLVASAAAARNQGDTASAIRLYMQAVQLNPQWPDGWWFLGVMQYGANQFAPARDALTHFIELKPNGAAALALRGLCEFETGQFNESLADIQHGITLGAAAQPRNAEILLYHEALLLTRLGYFEEAIGKYTNFVKQGKQNPELITAIGLAGLRMPVFPQDADPAQAELIAMTGTAAAKLMGGDMDAARDAFQQLFAHYPDTPKIHYLYGYLLFATQPDAAIAQFQQELTISPNSAVANAMLAWAYGIQGNYGDSLPVAQKAVAEDPTLAMGQLVLGRAMVETGDTTAALPHLEKVLQLEPGNLEAHLTLAKAYSKLGRKDDARRERLLCLQLSTGGAAPSATP